MTPIGDTTQETFDVASELEQLESLTMAALKRRYRQATGHDSKTRNRQYLIRRLIWIAQAASAHDRQQAAFVSVRIMECPLVGQPTRSSDAARMRLTPRPFNGQVSPDLAGARSSSTLTAFSGR
jgi:hypothetical protein